MKNVTNSVNQVPVRLTSERWLHIVENHDDLAGYYLEVLEAVSSPTLLLEGDFEEIWAIKQLKENKVLLVIYREDSVLKDGFIITAFFTTKLKKLLKRKILWHSQKH